MIFDYFVGHEKYLYPIQFDIDRSYHCHNRESPLHNLRHTNLHKFGYLDQKLYHWGTKIESFVPIRNLKKIYFAISDFKNEIVE